MRLQQAYKIMTGLVRQSLNTDPLRRMMTAIASYIRKAA